MMRKLFALALLALVGIGLASLAPTTGQAQQTPPNTPRTQSQTQPVATQNSFYAWVSSKQADYNRRLADTIREIKTGDPLIATLLLSALSFAYGVLHAAGPGHGKAVITSYALANERTVKRGIALSFLAALFQAFSALILVGVLFAVFKATGAARKTTEAWLETLSWALIAALGAWLFYRQMRKFLASRSAKAAAAAHSHTHAHHHHDHGHPSHAHHNDAGHGHAHSHTHNHAHDAASCEVCDHAHMPDPKQLEGQWSWSKAIALAAAVGIRPCTGAIFVLGFAISQGLLWAGVIATFAMALGTAITVSTLAAIAVFSREWAAKLGSSGGSVWGQHVRTAAGICGSFTVMVLGLVLFWGSLGSGSAF